jgi:hypothetical protein
VLGKEEPDVEPGGGSWRCESRLVLAIVHV